MSSFDMKVGINYIFVAICLYFLYEIAVDIWPIFQSKAAMYAFFAMFYMETGEGPLIAVLSLLILVLPLVAVIASCILELRKLYNQRQAGEVANAPPESH